MGRSLHRRDVLVLLNGPATIKHVAEYLEGNGYKLTFVTSVGEAIQILNTKRPDALLMSWNLRGADIVRLYTVFTNTFKHLCIVFPEETSNRDVAGLIKSRIPKTVLPPLSGPSFLRRLDSLYKNHQEVMRWSSPYIPAAPPPAETAMVYPEDVPADTQWSKIPEQLAGPLQKNHSAWKGSSQSKPNDNYYFKGPECPRYDQDKHQWDNMEPTDTVIERSRDTSKTYHAPGEAVDAEALSLLAQNRRHKERTKFSENEFNKYFAPMSPSNMPSQNDACIESPIPELAPLVESAERLSLLMQCGRRALNNWMATFPGLLADGPASMMILASPFSSQQFKGYLVFVCPEINSLVQKTFFNFLVEELNTFDEQAAVSDEFFSVDMDIHQFLSLVKKSKNEVMSINADGQVLNVAFLREEELPVLQATELLNGGDKRKFVGFDQKKWLFEKCVLRFDLYLHLPQNEKVILYLKSGTTITNNILRKFTNFNVALRVVVWVKNDHFSINLV